VTTIAVQRVGCGLRAWIQGVTIMMPARQPSSSARRPTAAVEKRRSRSRWPIVGYSSTPTLSALSAASRTSWNACWRHPDVNLSTVIVLRHRASVRRDVPTAAAEVNVADGMPAFITDEVFEVRFIIPIISLYLTANGAVAYLHSVHVQLEIERRNFTSRNKETATIILLS